MAGEAFGYDVGNEWNLLQEKMQGIPGETRNPLVWKWLYAAEEMYKGAVAAGEDPQKVLDRVRNWMDDQVGDARYQYLGEPIPPKKYTITKQGGSGLAQQLKRPDPNTPAPGGVLTTPGSAEQWYAQNKGQYTQPTEYGGWFDEYKNKGGWTPTEQTAAWDNAKTSLGTTGWGVDNAKNMAQKLGSRKTSGESTMHGALSYFQGADSTSKYANSLDKTQFTTPGAMEQFNTGAQKSLSGTGQGAQYAYNSLSGFGKTGAAEDNVGEVRGMLGNAGKTSGYFDNDIKGPNGLLSRNTTGKEFDYFQPQLREKSYSENLYESGNKGLNTFYDREHDKRSKRLSDQMSAMGVFGSGAMARSMFELEGEMGANQARDMAALAGQADQARLGRAGAAQSFSSAAGGEEIGRYGLGLDAAKGADESTRANAGILTNAANYAQVNQLARQRAGVDAALGADASYLDRIMGAGTLANNAQTQWGNRLKTGLDIYDTADASKRAQGTAIQGLGKAEADTEIGRLRDAANIGINADNTDLARVQAYLGGSKDMDAARLERDKVDAGFFATVDAQKERNRDAAFNAAARAQELFQGRERLGIQDMTGVASQMSSLVASFTGASANEQANIREQIIQLMVTQMGMSRAQAESSAANFLGAAGTVAGAAQTAVRSNVAAKPTTTRPTGGASILA
jgi:hypothetical protein